MVEVKSFFKIWFWAVFSSSTAVWFCHTYKSVLDIKFHASLAVYVEISLREPLQK